MRDHNAASSLAMPFRAADLQMEEIADDGLDLPIEVCWAQRRNGTK